MVEIIHEQQLDLSPGAGKNSDASPFDQIKRTRDDGTEYWSARDLMPLLGYDRWEHSRPAIDRAEATAENQGFDVETLFRVNREKTTGRPREDVLLTRYAAYLVAMNGDPRKAEVAAAQSYFAIRTREAEVTKPQLDPGKLSKLEILQMAIESEQGRLEAQRVVDAVEGNDGLSVRDFHKHYFPDVRESDFNAVLYNHKLLIDQRGARRGPNGRSKPGKQHRHPTYKGKAYFYLNGTVDENGDRWESVRVRPGTPEADLRDLLIKKGLPAPAQELIA